MQYFISIADPQIAEQVEKYLQTLEKVQVVAIPAFDGSFEPQSQTDFVVFLVQLWQFLAPENQEKVYHYLSQILQSEIDEQSRLFMETTEEDIALANENMRFYAENLKLIDQL